MASEARKMNVLYLFPIITCIAIAMPGNNHVLNGLKFRTFAFLNNANKMAASGGDLSWYFSQVKGTLDDDVAEGFL